MKITRISTSAWIEARTENKMQLQGDYYGPLKNEKRKKKLIKVIIIIVAKGSCLFLNQHNNFANTENFCYDCGSVWV